jgi:hypothetical protein
MVQLNLTKYFLRSHTAARVRYFGRSTGGDGFTEFDVTVMFEKKCKIKCW